MAEKRINVSPIDPLATRDEWHGSVRQQFPLEAPDQDNQPAYTISTYPFADVSIYALKSLAARLDGTWADVSMSLHQGNIMSKAAKNEGVTDREVLDKLLSTSQRRRDLIKSDTAHAMEAGLEEVRSMTDDRYRQGLVSAIERGYLPAEALRRFEESLRHTSIRTTSEALGEIGKDRFSGHYDPIRNEVISYNPIKIDSDEVKVVSDRVDTLGHEFGHNNSGGTYLRGTDGNIYRTRTGFSDYTGLSDLSNFDSSSKYTKMGLNEAVNQIVNLGILTGDFETLDPDKRVDGIMTRYGVRKLLAVVYEKAQGQLNVRTLTNAFAEETGPGGGLGARRKLITEFVRVYGHGSLRALEVLMSNLESVGESPYMISRHLECVHAPEFDDSGNLVRSGYIATTVLPDWIGEDFKDLQSIREFYDSGKGEVT